MKTTVLYIHGKGGNSEECEHYRPLFPDCDVIGLDYKTFTPWETGAEIHTEVNNLKSSYDNIILIANSIGAFFAMNADIESMINTAYFISPVVDMEKLICEMMKMSNVTESQLVNCGIINTPFGEQLSWKYLCYVRENPIKWTVSTHILYGGRDNITSFETIDTFAKQFNADLTVLDNCEHWFHTEEQLKLLDKWILEN